jgi:hypothetical protein
LSSNSARLSSAGFIELGAANTDNIVRLDANNADYRMWIGRNSATTAPFRVTKEGALYASGATITGNSTFSGTLSVGASLSDGGTIGDVKTTATAASNTATAASNTATAASNTATSASNLAATKLTKSAATITDSSNNMTAINAGGITVYSGASATSGARVVMNSDGIAGYNSSNVATFSVEASSGNAIFKGDITGASGTFSGPVRSNISDPATSSYFDTQGSLGGVSSGLVIGAIGFKNTSVGGWTSHCYPYMPGSPNIDLGTPSFRWNDVRSSGRVFMGHGGSDTITNVTGQQPYSVFLNTGRIYANTLGTGSGTGLVQDSSGYIRVSSSSIRYKENISEIENIGYLDAVNLLKPVKFSYKLQEEDIDGTPGYETVRPVITGLIAEDVEQIDKLKDLVNYNTLGETEGLAYDRLTAVLALAIQEISNKIDMLASRLDALEA